MKHIQESIIGRKGIPLQAWHTGDLAYMNINGPNIPGNSDYVWVYLYNHDAKKRINEFESNKKLQEYIYRGMDVFVKPTTSDFIYVGQPAEKFLSNYAHELTRMDRLNLNPKKTIQENLEENNYGL